MLREDEGYQKTHSKYVYVHMFRDKDGEAFQAWSKRVKAPVHAIPQVNIVKPNGKLVYSQSGGFKDLHQTLAYKAMELSGDQGIAELVAEFKVALKEADGLVEEGKFVSGYERLAVFPEGMTLDEKTKSLLRATVKRIEAAALRKIDEATRPLVEGDAEGKRLDGLYQLTIIRGRLKRMEPVRAKANAQINALLAIARIALYDEDVDKARRAYEKLLTEHEGSEAAKRAKVRLDELDRK